MLRNHILKYFFQHLNCKFLQFTVKSINLNWSFVPNRIMISSYSTYIRRVTRLDGSIFIWSIPRYFSSWIHDNTTTFSVSLAATKRRTRRDVRSWRESAQHWLWGGWGGSWNPCLSTKFISVEKKNDKLFRVFFPVFSSVSPNIGRGRVTAYVSTTNARRMTTVRWVCGEHKNQIDTVVMRKSKYYVCS